MQRSAHRLSILGFVLLVNAFGCSDGAPASHPIDGEAPSSAVRADEKATLPAAPHRAAFLGAVQSMAEGPTKDLALEYAWGLYDEADVRATLTNDRGEVVDCLDMARQPALRRGDGTYAEIVLPTHVPERRTKTPQRSPVAATASGPVATCPASTVPRVRPDEGAFARFVAKRTRTAPAFPRRVGLAAGPEASDYDWFGTPPYETTAAGGYEHARAIDAEANQGLTAVLSVHKPTVQASGEHTVSQVWVMGQNANDCANPNLGYGTCQSVEAGWLIDSRNTNPFLVIFSEPDNYDPTGLGCFAPDCPNWVAVNQGNDPLVPNQFLTPLPAGGNPEDFELQIDISEDSSNWYVFADGKLSGYFTPTYYKCFGLLCGTFDWFTSPGLLDGSNLIRFGGEVINDNTGGSASDPLHTGHHTTTQMGSGQPASAEDGTPPAAYQRGLGRLNPGAFLFVPPTLSINSGTNDFDHPGCYGLRQTGAHKAYFGTSPFIYFGGKGYDASTCP